MNKHELALWQIRAICKSIDSEILANDLTRKALQVIIKICERYCNVKNEPKFKKVRIK